MWQAISNNPDTGSDRLQPDPPGVNYFDMLHVCRADLEWAIVPIYPETMRLAFDRQKKRIARMAKEDIEHSLRETIAATKMLQAELDKRTYQAKLKRVNDAARSIARHALRIERISLKILRGGKGFRP